MHANKTCHLSPVKIQDSKRGRDTAYVDVYHACRQGKVRWGANMGLAERAAACVCAGLVPWIGGW